MTNKERLRYYRKYVYEAGALDRTNSDMAKVMDSNIIEKERQKDYDISRMDRFMYRSRYFTDSESLAQRGLFPGITGDLKINLCRNGNSANRR